MELSGEVAIVTGGASGLGGATAFRFAEDGAKVAILDLESDRLHAAAERIGALAVPCDVVSSGAAENAIASVAEKLGAPRILVNCAGVAPAKKIIGREGPSPLADFEKVIAINLTGTFNLMRLAAHVMKDLEPGEDGERGVIVNTASIAAYEAQIGQAAYGASKGGVAALTLPAAREFARYGIRVVAIAPSLMGTPMVSGMPEDVQASVLETIPFPSRFGKPEEFAALAAHIVENRLLNGGVIRLDAALRMGSR